MTPLMLWIAQGRKKRDREHSSIARMKSDVHRKSLEDLSQSANLDDISPNQVVRQRERRITTNQHKAPRCLEISLPVIRGMKDSTVEPVQDFFNDQSFDAWEFNVFELENVTKGHSLWFLGMIIFWALYRP